MSAHESCSAYSNTINFYLFFNIANYFYFNTFVEGHKNV